MPAQSGDHVVKMSKLIYADGETFMPSRKEQQVLSDIIDLFRQTQSQRNRNYQYFDGLSLIEYINDLQDENKFKKQVWDQLSEDQRQSILSLLSAMEADWQKFLDDPYWLTKQLNPTTT